MAYALDKVGTGIMDAASIYMPVILRLAITELDSLHTFVFVNNDAKSALQLMHDKMTPEELAAEKVKLAGLTEQMANNNAAKHEFANAIVSSIVKTSLALFIGGL